MYHDVVSGIPGIGGGPERFAVSLASFEQMLDAIRATGNVGCSLGEALQAHDVPRVAITFDDGTVGQFEQAVPALREWGMTATFFVTTDWVGASGYMSWDQLRQLTEWGMSVQSHTRSHPHLSELDAQRLQRELAESKMILDQELGQDTTQLGLPHGNAPRPWLRHVMIEVGYRIVATSRWGRNRTESREDEDELMWIRRCTVPRSLDSALADRIVSGSTRLAVTRYSREAALNGVRSVVGASRYHRWRRRVLDALAR